VPLEAAWTAWVGVRSPLRHRHFADHPWVRTAGSQPASPVRFLLALTRMTPSLSKRVAKSILRLVISLRRANNVCRHARARLG
jgi:hypothetical protein